MPEQLNDQESRPHPLEYLLAFATLFVSVEAFLIDLRGWPSLTATLLVALAISQIGLLAIWATFSVAAGSLPLLGVAIGVLVWCLILDSYSSFDDNCFLLFSVEVATLSVPLAIVRLSGCRLESAWIKLQVLSSGKWTQFTLRLLLLWASGIAIVLGVSRRLHLSWNWVLHEWHHATVLGMAFGILCALALLCTLYFRRSSIVPFGAGPPGRISATMNVGHLFGGAKSV